MRRRLGHRKQLLLVAGKALRPLLDLAAAAGRWVQAAEAAEAAEAAWEEAAVESAAEAAGAALTVRAEDVVAAAALKAEPRAMVCSSLGGVSATSLPHLAAGAAPRDGSRGGGVRLRVAL